MSAFPTADNPIVYAQFNMQGRWKRMLIVSGVYGLLLGTGIWLSTLGSDHFHNRDLLPWIAIITVLQVLDLLVFGAFRVESAVRGDVTSRMLESHRLMPTPALGAILGYIVGASLQALLLAASNFVLGAVCCAIAGQSLNQWAVLNGMLLFFSLLIYALITQFSFIARGGFMLLLITGILSIVSSGSEVLQLLPSASVLLFPLFSRSSVFVLLFNGFGARLSADVSFAYACALVGQAVFMAIAIRIGMRRYLSAGAIGVSPQLGLLILLTWVALAMVQFSSPDSFSFHRYYPMSMNAVRGNSELVEQTVASLCTSLLLATLPIASAARTAREWQRSGSPGKPKAYLSESATVIAASGIICLPVVFLCVRFNNWQAAAFSTLAGVLNFLIAVGCFFSWGYLRRRRAWVITSIWVVVTWLGPVIADAVYRGMTDSTVDATQLTALSLPGMLALVWSGPSVSVLPGIAGQIGFSVMPVGLLMLAKQRAPKGPMMAVQAET